MKTLKFWRMEVQQLSFTERMFLINAIKMLLTWEVLKEEYLELDLIKRLLETEIQINTSKANGDKKKWWDAD
ncbi:MAG TPA: hypothetical protein VEF37_00700 [Thermodesulfovibrionales bacterium]|nr:hypothetical protein [Thermodesulfovibrionales bacterium]